LLIFLFPRLDLFLFSVPSRLLLGLSSVFTDEVLARLTGTREEEGVAMVEIEEEADAMCAEAAWDRMGGVVAAKATRQWEPMPKNTDWHVFNWNATNFKTRIVILIKNKYSILFIQ
jgi:hypothetical protein